MHVFDEQSRILVNKLNQAVVMNNELNIFPFVTLCTLDVICGETYKVIELSFDIW